MPRQLQSWINTYLDYVKDTEPPLNYHIWSAISVIGAALKRNVFLKKSYTLYPNQYIILTGPPAVGKGSAIKPAVELAHKADVINYLSDRLTAERIIQRMSNGFTRPGFINVNGVAKGVLQHDSVATIVSTELPVFLGASTWMLEFLCEMWDKNTFDYETKHGTVANLTNLATSLLGGCVPDFIRKINKDSGGIVTGGFTSRCIFAYADKPFQELPWPSSLEVSPHIPFLIDDLKHIGTLHGEMKLHPRAYLKYELYYKDCCKNGKFEPSVVLHFKARASRAHVLKTAMCLCTSESDSLEISEIQMERAIQLIEQVQNDLERVFRFVGANRELEATENIMAFLEHKGMASFDEILMANYRYLENMSEEGLQRILSVLCSMKFCKIESGMYKIVTKTRGKGLGIP